MGCVTQLTAPSGTTQSLSEFDRTTAVQPADRPGVFSIELDPGWSSLVGVHGGYLCAVAVRGAEAVAPDRVVRTLTTSFLRTADVGPATVEVHEVRRGRTMSTVTVEVVQHDRTVLASRMTMLTPRAGVEWSAPEPIDLPPRNECVRMAGDRVSHFDRVDGLLDPASLPFSGGARASVRGYLRPLDTRRVDSAWLAMASDWFPPPAFVRLEPPVGGVSVDLTTHIHRPELELGDDEWLTGSFSIDTSTGGLAVEHGTIRTAEGVMVAESFQTRLTAEA